jgi:hypothetical protein
MSGYDFHLDSSEPMRTFSTDYKGPQRFEHGRELQLEEDNDPH